jgi:hypothetical protein
MIGAAVCLLRLLCPANAAEQDPRVAVLENESLRAETDRGSGVIRRILDKRSQLELAAVAGLADNFRLALRSADQKQRFSRKGRSIARSKISRAGPTMPANAASRR